MNWLQELNRFPPCVVRLIARKSNGRQWRSTRDIARGSGLSIQRVAEISLLKQWDDLPAKTIVAFLRGCGVNLDDYRGRERTVHFIARAKMAHLRDLNGHRLALYTRLMELSKSA